MLIIMLIWMTFFDINIENNMMAVTGFLNFMIMLSHKYLFTVACTMSGIFHHYVNIIWFDGSRSLSH